MAGAGYAAKLKAIQSIGKLKTSDQIEFTRVEVTNNVFGLGYKKAPSCAHFMIRGLKNEEICFPCIPQNSDWLNTFSHNGQIWQAEYIGSGSSPYINNPNLKTFDKNLKKNVFGKYKSKSGKVFYRFVGVYKFIGSQGTILIHEKICDWVKI